MNESRQRHFRIDTPLHAEHISAALGNVLPLLPLSFWRATRWFGSKTREIAQVTVRDRAIFGEAEPMAVLSLVDIAFRQGEPETYFVPLAIRGEEAARRVLAGDENSIVLVFEGADGTAVVYDAFADQDFCSALFRRIARSSRLAGISGTFSFDRTRGPHGWLLRASSKAPTPICRLIAEQSNSSVVFADDYVLKAFRKLQPGVNPDLEVTRFLTTKAGFRDVAALAGDVGYTADGFSSSIAMLQRFVPNAGDGWQYTLKHLEGFFKQARAVPLERLPAQAMPGLARAFATTYFDEIVALGRVTGELHNALASDENDENFAPEPLTREDLEQWARGIDVHISKALDMVSGRNFGVDDATGRLLQQVAGKQSAYRGMVKGLLALDRSPIAKIRIHGDYHLGQVLRTEDSFAVLDFEGEPGRPVAERRSKQLALKDVAGMLRSFNYAMHTALRAMSGTDGSITSGLEQWARAWEAGARGAFLDGYLQMTLARQAPFLPPTRSLIELTLAIFELDKAIYELDYEANNRPDWLAIPLGYLAGV